jgi:multicomponent Na+:H+ antiporter subunit B
LDRLPLVFPVLLLIALALTVMRLNSLLAIAILSGIYSLVLALVYTLLDAVDVAFTEAAVGAGVTLTLMLAAISLTTSREAPRPRVRWRQSFAFVVAVLVAVGLGYATTSLSALGDGTAAMHYHVAPRYLSFGQDETGVPNIVTAILASYRGYDTLGEVTVIFTAGISVIALLWRWRTDQS